MKTRKLSLDFSFDDDYDDEDIDQFLANVYESVMDEFNALAAFVSTKDTEGEGETLSFILCWPSRALTTR